MSEINASAAPDIEIETDFDGTGPDIAIIGMAGRFPGAPDVDTFWVNIRDGVESIIRYDDDALRALGVSEADIADPLYVKAGAPLPDVDKFDAAFFGHSPREAEEIDPQHRLFLETAWAALEHAGYDPTEAAVPIGVYAGVGVNTYLLAHLMPAGRIADFGDISSLQGLMNGNNKDSLATSAAYKLNLKGPAVTVQTACSTSLAAVHFACRSLLNHETDMALAGGVWVNLVHKGGYRHQPGAILSPDGRCRAFDADAAGTVIGSGLAAVTLKRLADARADGDTIHAVIRGSALNNDGAAKVGFTAPSVEGQAEVIMAAQAVSDVAPETITYVEAHGTGTTMGDPIEIAALNQAFRAGGDERVDACAIGSVKTNVGHLDAAAGIAGLIKAAMALKHRTLPPSLGFEKPNPRIDFAGGPFRVNTERRDWPEGPTPRRAGVSSFGIGGTNVHVVLEEAPQTAALAPSARVWQPLILSARTPTALKAAAGRLAEYLARHPEQGLADMGHTLRLGRKPMAHRAAVVARDHAEAITALKRIEPHAADERASVAFLFPGQGAQYADMGRALYETEPVFRAEVDRCAEALRPHMDRDIRELILPTAFGGDVAAAETTLAETAITQPALFTIECALARLMMSWGVRPAAMIGHSVGEYVAAHIAGVFSLEDAARLVAARGRLLQSLPPGAMLAVNMRPEDAGEDAAALLGDGCDLAAVNAPDRLVLSGPEGVIADRAARCVEMGVAAQRLRVSHAFHSAMMTPAAEALAALVAETPRRAPTIPFISNVTGDWITAEQATEPAYWGRHLRSAVRFADGVARLCEDPSRVLLEVGPGESLSRLARRHPTAASRTLVPCLPSHHQADETLERVTTALGRVWTAGVAVDWRAWNGEERRRRVPLPTYPFEGRSYWVEPGGLPAAADDLTRPLDRWFHIPSWRRMAETSASRPAATQGVTLLLTTEGPLADALRAALEPETTIVMVTDEPTDWDAFVTTIGKDQGPITRVVHGWTLGRTDAGLDLGYLTLTRLADALSRLQRDVVTELVIVTEGLEEVTGTERLDPRNATLIGPLRVIPQEYPALSCRLIDLDGTSPMDRVVAAILDRDTPPVMALRGRHRWEPVNLPTTRPAPVEPPFRKGGVHLITGGLGGIGLVLARHLAERAGARLALVGRSAPSPAQREAIAALEAAGSEVLVLSADVAAPGAMEQVIAQVHARFGPIDGVIHAAGHAGSGLIAQETAEKLREVLAPKVAGTDALLAALDTLQPDHPPGFVLLCASISTIAGGIGKCAYVAANAHLDVVARAASRDGRFPVVAVAWDGWREVGMAGGMAMPDGVGIAPTDGALAFERIVAEPQTPRIIVSTLDLDTRLEHARGDLLAQPLPDKAGTRRGGYERPDIATAYVAPDDPLTEGLAAIWGEMLGVDRVGVDDDLFDLGGDSLLGIQILARTRARHGVDVHPAAFFKRPTLTALAELVEDRLIDEIERTAAE